MPTNSLSHLLAARIGTIQSKAGFVTVDIVQRNRDEIDHLCKNFMPSGSGFDNGTMFDEDRSNPAKLVFSTGFHHMDAFGSYDGWTHHMVTATAAFDGFDVKVSGKDRNGIKDYIAEMVHNALTQTIQTEWKDGEFLFILQR